MNSEYQKDKITFLMARDDDFAGLVGQRLDRGLLSRNNSSNQ